MQLWKAATEEQDMDFTNYGKEVQDLAEEMYRLRLGKDGAYMESCRKLAEIGKKENDSRLLGFAYYYLAESYLCLNDHHNLVLCLAESIVNQQKTSQWDLLIRSHNVMGVDAYNRGNTTVALDQYITALSYGEKYKFPYETALVNCNIGRLYMGFGEYSSAIRYLEKARDSFYDYRDDFFGRGNLANAYASLGRCSLFQNKLEEAVEYEGKIRGLGGEDEDGIDFFVSQGLFARICHQKGELQERDQYIRGMIKKLDEVKSFTGSHEELFDFLDFLLEIGKYEELREVFPRLEVMAEESGITHLKMELMRRQAEYYRAVQDRENYLEVCARLYEEGQILREEKSRNILTIYPNERGWC